MQFPTNFNLKTINIIKITGLVLAVIVIITLGFRLIGASFSSIFNKNYDNLVYQSASNMGVQMGYNESPSQLSYDASAVGLSERNVVSSKMPIAVNNPPVSGNDAENFEVTTYNARIETRFLKDTCDKVAGLKSREDVIFENANKYEKNCNYTFKIKKTSVPEILNIIKALNPKELNENIFTIKKLISDYTSSEDILKKKLNSVETTLSGAIFSYDEIAKLATKTKDVDALAKIIDSKIGIIERLTQERININAQLEQLGRAKADQLDRLDYVYFNVSIFENKFIDGQNLKDSWKEAIKLFVRDINKFFQGITLSLVGLLFMALQYVVYLLIVLLIAKYGWKFAKRIWMK